MDELKVDAKRILKDWFYHESYRTPIELVDYNTGSESDVENRLRALCYCASADGIITEKERLWILGSALARGCSLEFIEHLREPNELELEDILNAIRNSIRGEPNSKSLIYNALRACGADGEITEMEKNRIIHFAKDLGLSEKFIHEIFELYTEEDAIKRKIGKLIG